VSKSNKASLHNHKGKGKKCWTGGFWAETGRQLRNGRWGSDKLRQTVPDASRVGSIHGLVWVGFSSNFFKLPIPEICSFCIQIM